MCLRYLLRASLGLKGGKYLKGVLKYFIKGRGDILGAPDALVGVV
jgi:hypothetical protein